MTGPNIFGLREYSRKDLFECTTDEIREADRFYIMHKANNVIIELKERSQWHRQKDKDIYFECGKHWGAEYIIKMKDGSTHLAYGGCDEGGDGSVSTFLHFQDEDYEWEYDDIDIWYEIPDHRIIGNIKESDK